MNDSFPDGKFPKYHCLDGVGLNGPDFLKKYKEDSVEEI